MNFPGKSPRGGRVPHPPCLTASQTAAALPTGAERSGSSHNRTSHFPKSQRGLENCDLRDFLLRPLQILPHLTRIVHTLSKARSRARQARLRLFLQLQELAVLCVQTTRTVKCAISSDLHSTFLLNWPDLFPAQSNLARSRHGLAKACVWQICGFKLEMWMEMKTHVCACVATALSRPSGSNALARWSCIYSLKSTPLALRSDS